MFIPNGFKPSGAANNIGYDQEGKLYESSISRGGTGGIGVANSLFATDAERFDACAPFLRLNKIRDARRRNYVIQPGGACLYFQGPATPVGVPPRTPFVNDKESFGHNTMEGTKMARGNESPFSLGESGVPTRRDGL